MSLQDQTMFGQKNIKTCVGSAGMTMQGSGMEIGMHRH